MVFAETEELSEEVMEAMIRSSEDQVEGYIASVCNPLSILGVGNLQPEGYMCPASNLYVARQAPRGKDYYGWILCVPLLEFWVQPAT